MTAEKLFIVKGREKSYQNDSVVITSSPMTEITPSELDFLVKQIRTWYKSRKNLLNKKGFESEKEMWQRILKTLKKFEGL